MQTAPTSMSDLVRQHAIDYYLSPARRRREKTFSVNAGAVHKALGLANRIAPVCAALASNKFLRENGVRLKSRTGPPSGQSTTVTFTYEFLDDENSAGPSAPDRSGSPQSRQAAWEKLRGALKDVFAEHGGGEDYLRAERTSFRDADERK